METELLKPTFFAQYWGQNVICNDDYIWRSNETFDTVLSIYNGDLSKWYAVLNSIDQISEEDCILISKIVYPEFNEKEIQNAVNRIKIHIDKYGIEYFFGEDINSNTIKIIDFFRSKGYALPWMYISVEEQVKLGWIKLK